MNTKDQKCGTAITNIEKVVWQCNFKFKHTHKRLTPALKEEAIKKSFINAYNKYAVNKDQIVEDLTNMLKITFDTRHLKSGLKKQ